MSIKSWLGRGGTITRIWKHAALTTAILYPLGIVLNSEIILNTWALIIALCIVGTILGLSELSAKGGAQIQAEAISKELEKRDQNL